MNGPHETLTVQLDPETIALVHIQIITPPRFPTPSEPDTLAAPTARQLDEIATQLAARKHIFPPITDHRSPITSPKKP